MRQSHIKIRFPAAGLLCILLILALAGGALAEIPTSGDLKDFLVWRHHHDRWPAVLAERFHHRDGREQL